MFNTSYEVLQHQDIYIYIYQLMLDMAKAITKQQLQYMLEEGGEPFQKIS